MADRARLVAWCAGAATVALALAPPVDAAAERSLTLHMVQHVALLVVAPPLIVLGFARARRPGITVAVATLVAQSIVMLAWHAPRFYDAADRSLPLHVLEHVSFVAAGLGFWWTLRTPRPASVLLLFFAALPGTALGVGLTLATHCWYAAYPRLADQQVAGVVMWGFASIVYVLAAAILFARWVAASGPAGGGAVEGGLQEVPA